MTAALRGTRLPTAMRSIVIGVVAASLIGLAGAPAHPAAAGGPLVGERAPSPTRSDAGKGSGEGEAPQPTGRIIVRYRDGLTEAGRARVRAAEKLELVAAVALPDTELLAPAGDGLAAAVARLGRNRDVAYADPEYLRTAMAGPTSEALFPQQWALHNTGQSVNGFAGAPDVDMNVPEAWSITTGDPALVVAVIDDGVDFTHPDLAGQAWVNPDEIAGNTIDDDGNGLVDDVNGWDFCNGDASVWDSGDDHGTHVAGSIAGAGNGTGIAGVAPQVKIMAIKFLDDDDLSCGTDVQAIAAVNYAAAHGVRIVNASWGGSGYSQALHDAVAAASGTLVVAAAGNANSDNDVAPIYPASFDLPNILSVAAIHNEGFLTDATNYGLQSVDLTAPGEDIVSSLPGATYGYGSGTSMAAANASGVAALAVSAKPSLAGDPSALRQHLIGTAKALPSSLGWVASPRLLDARAAVVSRPDISRLAGGDRYATAAAISAGTFVPHVPYLFVATGATFPDALAGGALAAQVGSPVLLVRGTSIPAATLSEIQRLKPFHIFVLGGSGVVSNGVVSQLAAHDDPTSSGPFRVAGADRYATAAAISLLGFEPGVPTAFIATGANFPDALSGAPASARLGGPLLLVRPTSIPGSTASELGRLHPERIVILGGTGAISAAVAAQLDAYTTGSVTRMSGTDRYATAAAVASQAFPGAETVFLATGSNFPDSLAGGPSSGAFGGPLLLLGRSSSPAPTNEQLVRLGPARIFVLGGTGVVPEAIVTQVRQLFP